MKRILFYTREGNGQAGFEIRTYDLTQALLSLGCDVSYISFKEMHSIQNESDLSFFQKIYFNLISFKMLLKRNPDVFVLQRVNFHMPAGLLYWILKRPVFILDIDDWEIREDLSKYFFGITNSVADLLMKIISRYSSYTIVSSHFLATYLKPYAKRLKKIPSGVCVNETASKSSLDVTIFNCVWAGSIDNGREEVLNDLIDLVSDFRKYAEPGIKFKIIARGGLVGNLSDYLKKNYDSRIHLIENCHRLKVPFLIGECQIGLLPLFGNSCFYRSKSPVKLFEYLKMGVIPVASSNCEAAEILTHGKNGFLVSSRKDMIRQVNQITAMPYDKIPSTSTHKLFVRGKYYSRSMLTHCVSNISFHCFADTLVGVIPVASSNCEAAEILTHGKNGFLVSSRKDMIRQVNQITAMPYEKLNEIRFNCIQCFQEKYSTNVSAKQWKEIFETQ